MQIGLFTKLYTSYSCCLREPVYNKLKEVAQKHKNLARISLLGVGISDAVLTITLVAIKAIECLLVIPINIIGAPFFNSCKLADAKEEAKRLLCCPVIIPAVFTLIIGNLVNPKEINHY